jgi:FixJ family two-component response regulator
MVQSRDLNQAAGHWHDGPTMPAASQRVLDGWLRLVDFVMADLRPTLATRQPADRQRTPRRMRPANVMVAKMSEAQSTVVVVDDDPEIREALGGLLRSVGLQVQLLASVPEFLKSAPPDGPTCLILDVRLPGQSGLDFQRELAAANIRIPIIFITGHADIPMSVQAMKGGALEFLTKPFRDQDLLDAIQLGLSRDRAWRDEDKALTALRERFNTLTVREREVMSLVVKGRLNKQIAADIGLSEVTVKVHRGQVMRKMQAKSLPELTRMADKLKLMPEISKSS